MIRSLNSFLSISNNLLLLRRWNLPDELQNSPITESSNPVSILRAPFDMYSLDPCVLTTAMLRPVFSPPKHISLRNGGQIALGLYSNLSAKCHDFTIPTKTNNRSNAIVTNCQYIGSYNWSSDHNDLSIIVPGSPREWHEQPLPRPLRPDHEGHYRQEYDKRMSSTPLLPLLLAVNFWHEQRTHQPSNKFPWSKVDFVANRNSLRQLLRILPKVYRDSHPYYHTSYNTQPKAFRIDIELAGTKTILFNRWEATASETVLPGSYGFNFEHAFTREADAVSSLDESGETARHHRINSYDFGGLQLVVRSEIDACLPLTESLSFEDDLSPIKITSYPRYTPYGLTIIPSYNPPTPQTDLIELSTLKQNKSAWLAEERYPQLFLSQVPNHYLAFHATGTITRIDKRDLQRSPELRSSAHQMQPKMNQLRELLVRIQSAVLAQAYQSYGNGKRKCFSLVYAKGQLVLYERVGERCLPEEALAMFNI